MEDERGKYFGDAFISGEGQADIILVSWLNVPCEGNRFWSTIKSLDLGVMDRNQALRRLWGQTQLTLGKNEFES